MGSPPAGQHASEASITVPVRGAGEQPPGWRFPGNRFTGEGYADRLRKGVAKHWEAGSVEGELSCNLVTPEVQLIPCGAQKQGEPFRDVPD